MTEDKNIKTPEERIADLEKQVEKLKKRGGGMLSSTDFLQLVIIENIKEARTCFWKRQWSKTGRRFIIDPFDPRNLTPFSYDLSVGNEIYRSGPETVKKFSEGDEDDTYLMTPGETIVVKTLEFIALPPYYSATVWPRFKWVTEGIYQSMVKIDPT